MSNTVVTAPAPPRTSSWPAELWARFVGCYFVLYGHSTLLWVAPKGEWLGTPYQKMWDAIAVFVGEHVLGIEGPIATEFNGSGDRTVNYLGVLVTLVLALVATAIWSAIARRRPMSPWTRDVLRTYARYVLAVTMLSYGLAKVFVSQFSFPSEALMAQSFGDSSPMRILWTFMGASEPYTIFTGALEVLGGLLLLSRRTTTMGALVVMGIMTNVVALNLCYDVPVKQYSTHLLLMATWLAAHDAKRLAAVLVLHRAVEAPAALRMRLPWRQVERARPWVKALVVGWILYALVEPSWTYYRESGLVMKAWLGRSFDVVSYRVDGEEVPPSLDEPERWRAVYGTGWQGLKITRMGERESWYAFDVDWDTMTLTLTSRAGDEQIVFGFRWVGADGLRLAGRHEGRDLVIVLKRRPPRLLETRGFHWINEYPYNI